MSLGRWIGVVGFRANFLPLVYYSGTTEHGSWSDQMCAMPCILVIKRLLFSFPPIYIIRHLICEIRYLIYQRNNLLY